MQEVACAYAVKFDSYVGEFQEIGNLTRLKNLKDLRFSDPQWGDSPLALLHNYQVSFAVRVSQTDYFISTVFFKLPNFWSSEEKQRCVIAQFSPWIQLLAKLCNNTNHLSSWFFSIIFRIQKPLSLLFKIFVLSTLR